MKMECRKRISADQVYANGAVYKEHVKRQRSNLRPAHSHQDDNVGGCTMNE